MGRVRLGLERAEALLLTIMAIEVTYTYRGVKYTKTVNR